MTHNLRDVFNCVEMVESLSYNVMMEIIMMVMDVQEIVKQNMDIPALEVLLSLKIIA